MRNIGVSKVWQHVEDHQTCGGFLWHTSREESLYNPLTADIKTFAFWDGVGNHWDETQRVIQTLTTTGNEIYDRHQHFVKRDGI